MQGVPEHFEHITDKAEFRRPPGRAGIELYRAHIVRHHFDAHTHEAYGFGVIEHSVVSTMIARNNVVRLKEEMGTEPRVYYLI